MYKFANILLFCCITMQGIFAQEIEDKLNSEKNVVTKEETPPKTDKNAIIKKDTSPKTEIIPKKKINRSVLILDFVNLNPSDKDAVYLSSSIADALLDPLKQTQSFELKSRSAINEKQIASFKKDNPTVNPKSSGFAITMCKISQADVVIWGSFITLNKKKEKYVRIQAKATECDTGRLVVSKNTMTLLDSGIFTKIDDLANQMATEMKDKLPPLTQRVVIKEIINTRTITSAFHFAKPEVSLLFHGSLPLLKPNEKLATGFGGQLMFTSELFLPEIQPIVQLDFSYLSGEQSVTSMTKLGFHLGFSYNFDLNLNFGPVKKFHITPFVNYGLAIGKIDATIGQATAYPVDYLVRLG